MKNYLLLVLIIFLSACSKEEPGVFKKNDFENNRWYKTQSLNLIYNNEEPKSIDLDFSLGYVYGSQFAEIPLEVYITNPLHQIDKIPVIIYLFDKNRNELGNCLGDLCDINQKILQNYNFSEPGKYKIQVLNTFSYEFLPNVNSIELKINH